MLQILWPLKTLDTFSYFQRPVFSLGVSQHRHKITNLCIFEVSWSLKWREKNGMKKKLCYFRGSCFSQCCILSTALHCSLPSKLLCSQLFWVITNSVQRLYAIAVEWPHTEVKWRLAHHVPCLRFLLFRHCFISKMALWIVTSCRFSMCEHHVYTCICTYAVSSSFDISCLLLQGSPPWYWIQWQPSRCGAWPQQ